MYCVYGTGMYIFLCFVVETFSVFYSNSFHFKYLCLVNGSADAVFLNRYAELYTSLAVQTVTNQFSLSICESSRMCCSGFEKSVEYLLDSSSSPLLHSYLISSLMSFISLGWKDLFLSCKKLFLCSQRDQAICHILL